MRISEESITDAFSSKISKILLIYYYILLSLLFYYFYYIMYTMIYIRTYKNEI